MSNDTISMDQLNVDNVSIDLTNNAAPSVTTTVIDLTNMRDQGSMEEQQPIPLNQPIRRKPTARKSIDELQVMSVEDLDAMVPKKEEAGPKGGVEKMKEDAKNRKKAREKQSELKQMKIGLKISDNDLNIKIRKIKSFLEDGDHCRIIITFKGREMAHKEIGSQLLNRILEQMADCAIVEGKPQFAGRNLSVGVRKK